MLSPMRGQAAELPKGILIGHQNDVEAATGCSVILCKEGAVASVAVRGGAPATRETDLLSPENTVQCLHAVVLSGGSAYGLDAGSGVMRYLEEQETGVPFAGFVVPIVVGASLFDLDIGSALRRPDAEMGYAAALAAKPEVGKTGSVGAGTGAGVGRFMGPDHAMKGGLGVASVRSGELIVSAVVAVNSLGAVFDSATGTYVAGAYVEKDGRKVIIDPLETLADLLPMLAAGPTDEPLDERGNTSIGAVITNAELSKAQAQRVASMAHDGLARSIYPAHTSFDGDALFALCTGEVVTQPDVVGFLAALAVEHAVLDAVLSAEEAYGLPAASTFG